MPSGIYITNTDNVQHFYNAYDKNNADNVVFAGNIDPGNDSPAFVLAANPNGLGDVNVVPAGMVGSLFYNVADNQQLKV